MRRWRRGERRRGYRWWSGLHDHLGQCLLHSNEHTDRPNQPMLCYGFRNRQLQFSGHMGRNRRNDLVWRRVYALRGGDCNYHRNINRGLHKIRLGSSNGHRPADNHFCVGGLFSCLHSDHADFVLYAYGDRYGKFQHVRHLVRQPHEYWSDQQCWRLLAGYCGKRNCYRNIDAGRNKVWQCYGHSRNANRTSSHDNGFAGGDIGQRDCNRSKWPTHDAHFESGD
jgi:hypothetical protein